MKANTTNGLLMCVVEKSDKVSTKILLSERHI